MSTHSYIPNPDAKFVVWLTTFHNYLSQIYPRINMPDSDFSQLTTKKDDFTVKFGISENPATRTKITIDEKNRSRKDLEDFIHQLVKEYISYNHLVTDTDRESLGVPVYTNTRTPAPIEDNPPGYEIFVKRFGCLGISFFNVLTNSRAKPKGQHGVEVGWVFSETPVTNHKQFTHSAFDTRSPLLLEFDDDDRGKTIYLALRWENTRGEKGPWSEIVKVLVP